MTMRRCVGLVMLVVLLAGTAAASQKPCEAKHARQVQQHLEAARRVDERIRLQRRQHADDDETTHRPSSPPSWAPWSSPWVFLKTHKTGSATLGGVLLRHAAYTSTRLLKTKHRILMKDPTFLAACQAEQQKEGAPRFAARGSLYHLSSTGREIGSYAEFQDLMRRFACTHTNTTQHLRGAPDQQVLRVITVLRDPVDHYLSHFSYYVQPSHRFEGTLASFVAAGRGRNLLAQEFGATTASELAQFLEDCLNNEAWFIAITERMHESLVLLALEFGWPLEHMVAGTIHNSHTEKGKVRYDNKILKPTPRAHELDVGLLHNITRLTTLDQILHQAATRRLNRAIERHGPLFHRAATVLALLQHSVLRLCECADLDAASKDVCAWFAMDDLQYEAEIRPDGHVLTRSSPAFSFH